MTEKRSRITALLSIATLSLITGCTDAEMRALLGEPSSDPVQPDQVIHASDTGLLGPPIGRDEFKWVYQQGGGLNDDGSFRQPIYSDDIYNQRIESGTVIHPAEWDPDKLQIEYKVEGGNVTGLNYLYRGDESQP